jgi:autotransporter passenger strand-loop-strand repeat protein
MVPSPGPRRHHGPARRQALELFGGATASATTVKSGGTLEIDAGYVLSGFAVANGATLEVLSGAPARSAIVSAVTDVTHFVSILLLGNYTAGSFKLGPEGGGGTGTLVTDPPSGTTSSVIASPYH